MKRGKRPFGVTIIAILKLLNALAILSAIGVLAIALSGGDLERIEQQFEQENDLRLTSIVLGMLGLVVAIGLWRLRFWAWAGIMILTGLSLATNLMNYFRGDPLYVAMAFDVLVVFYLNQRDVRRAFIPRADHAPEVAVDGS